MGGYANKPNSNEDLKSLTLEELKKKLGFFSDGLSEAEVAKRLTQYGPNEIKEKKTNPILKFLSYFWGPIPWMIEVATLIAVYGLLMTPLGWKWAGFVWGYAIVWFLLNGRVKLLAYRIFDPVKPKHPRNMNPFLRL